MGKKRCTPPQPQVLRNQLTRLSECRSSVSDVSPVTSEEDPEPEYELLVEVEEHISGRKVSGVNISAVVSGKTETLTTNDAGRISRQADSGGKSYDLTVIPSDPLHSVQTRNPRAVTQEVGGNPVKIVLERALFEIATVDHHFVPGTRAAEHLEIKYNLNKCDQGVDKKLFLCVRSEQHTPDLLYEAEIADKSDGAGTIKWDGKANCVSGPLKDKYVGPAYGPFKVSLELRGKAGVLKVTDDKPEAVTFVLCRELRAEPLSWADAYKGVAETTVLTFPAGGTSNAKLLWLQYRLNELGYPAGPLAAVHNPATKLILLRACFKYSQFHRQLPGISKFDTINAGWGWEQAWTGKFGTLAEICAGPTKAPGIAFLNALNGNEQPIADVVEQAASLTDPATDSRLILDHNMFYVNKDFLRKDVHVEYDAQLLNPIVIPLCAKLKLLSRTDADGSAPGVDAPEQMLGITCEWVAFDPEEDNSVVPESSADAAIKSRAKDYLGELLKMTAANSGDKKNAQDNCPVTLGGKRSAVLNDSRPYFRVIPKLFDGAGSGAAGIKSYSAVNTDTANAWGKPGYTGIFFEPSYIGGDNYIVQARISFDHVPDNNHRNAIIKAHQEIAGLAKSLGPVPAPMDTPADDPLAAQTGALTVWRRYGIAQEVRWTEVNYAAINWPPIVDNFKAAHIILTPPADPPARLTNVLLPADRTHVVNALIAHPGNQALVVRDFANRVAAMNATSLYPVPLATLAQLEAENGAGPKPTPLERWDVYKIYLGDAENWVNYTNLTDAIYAIRDGFYAQHKTNGLIIIRATFMPTPDFTAVLPNDVRTAPAVQPHVNSFVYRRGMALGGDAGVVILDQNNTGNLDETYIVSHEIAHCLFGTHPFEIGDTSHDKADPNCMMYYNSNVNVGVTSGQSIAWGLKTPIGTKYAVMLLIPAIGAIREPMLIPSGAGFTAVGARSNVRSGEGNDRGYLFEGSPAQIQAALNNLVLTRDPRVDVNEHIQVYVVPDGASGLRPDLDNGGLTIPLTKYLPAREQSAKLFEDIRMKAITPADTKPQFCGKCLAKFRGWKVADNTVVPERTVTGPITNPQMHFLGYEVADGNYFYKTKNNEAKQVFYKVNGTRFDSTVHTGPVKIGHLFCLTWECASGILDRLTGIRTREYVRFRTSTQAAPFNYAMDPDIEFTQLGSDANVGFAEDMHTFRQPAITCRRDNKGEPVPGDLIAEQKYEYSTDNGRTWIPIPNAAFLIYRSVYRKGKHLYARFLKTNWPEHNPVSFEFKVSYAIKSAPKQMPLTSKVPPAQNSPGGKATHAKPYRTGGSAVYVREDEHVTLSTVSKSLMSNADLVKKGVIVDT